MVVMPESVACTIIAHVGHGRLNLLVLHNRRRYRVDGYQGAKQHKTNNTLDKSSVVITDCVESDSTVTPTATRLLVVQRNLYRHSCPSPSSAFLT